MGHATVGRGLWTIKWIGTFVGTVSERGVRIRGFLSMILMGSTLHLDACVALCALR